MRLTQLLGTIFIASKWDEAEERAKRMEELAQRAEARAQREDAVAAAAQFQVDLCKADRSLANQQERRRAEINHWVRLRLAHGKGEGFRVFELNPFATALHAIQGRVTTAVPYDDGRTRGYLVFDEDYENPRILSIKQFGRRYRAWVHTTPTANAATGCGNGSSARRPLAPSQSQIEDPRFTAFVNAQKQANPPGSVTSQPEPASYAPTQDPLPIVGNIDQFCVSCGRPVVIGDRFCGGCGRQLGT